MIGKTSREYFSSDERLITVEDRTVTVAGLDGAKLVKRRLDFSSHPVGEIAIAYVVADCDQRSAGTAITRGEHLNVLGDFMLQHSLLDLNPAAFQVYLKWIGGVRNPRGGHRFNDASMRCLAGSALSLYEFGATRGYREWTVRNLDAMRMCKWAVLRGSSSRSRRRASFQALAPDEVFGLLRAARLELEECERVAAARLPAGQMEFTGAHPKRIRDRALKRHDPSLWPAPANPNPYVPFAILLALRNALRSAEFNELRVGDMQLIGETAGELLVHARNKEPAVLRLDAATVTAWRLCMAWSECARSKSQWPDRMLHWWAMAGRSNWIGTRTLNGCLLPSFYAKYFARMVEEDGKSTPVLHAHAARETDPMAPFSSAYNVFRTAAAVMFANKERNLALTQRFLRHRRSATTEIYYLPKRAGEHAVAVAIALRSAAQIVAIGLKNQVVTSLTPELVKIELNGSRTPFGTCGDPGLLEAKGPPAFGRGCARARDCLECEFLYLHAHKRPLLVEDRDRLLSLAQERQREGYLRDAENLRAAAALREANVNRIDELAGGDR